MKAVIPYSFLFLGAYLLNRFVISARQTLPGDSLRLMLICFAILAVAFLVIDRIVKEWHRANFLTFLILLDLLFYQAVFRWVKLEVVRFADLAGLLIIIFIAFLYAFLAHPRWWTLLPSPAAATRYLTTMSVVLLGIQAGLAGVEFLPRFKNRTGPALSAIHPMEEEIRLSAGNRPDIYLLVLDGYGGHEVLQEIYGHDNAGFLSQLEARGFYVARRSHGNYVQTAYSIASLLNFDYIQGWQGSQDYYEYLVGPIENNRAFGLLKAVGYTTIGFEGVTSYTQVRRADLFHSASFALNEFEVFLLTDTPFEVLSNLLNWGRSIPTHDTHRQRILAHLDTIEGIPDTVAGPKIAYLHLPVPHPPFVFDSAGNPIEPLRPYSFSDANEFPGTLEEYRLGYREQVTFLNNRILRAVDAILDNSAAPPVILLMSDHGPGSMFSWDPEHPGCLWERTSNLYALYLPGPASVPALQQSLSPVNTFRIVFNAYFGTRLPLLDDRTYFATWQHPELIMDVTSQRDSRDSCRVPEP